MERKMKLFQVFLWDSVSSILVAVLRITCGLISSAKLRVGDGSGMDASTATATETSSPVRFDLREHPLSIVFPGLHETVQRRCFNHSNSGICLLFMNSSVALHVLSSYGLEPDDLARLEASVLHLTVFATAHNSFLIPLCGGFLCRQRVPSSGSTAGSPPTSGCPSPSLPPLTCAEGGSHWPPWPRRRRRPSSSGAAAPTSCSSSICWPAKGHVIDGRSFRWWLVLASASPSPPMARSTPSVTTTQGSLDMAPCRTKRCRGSSGYARLRLSYLPCTLLVKEFVPHRSLQGVRIVQAAAGAERTLLVTDAGRVYQCGKNYFGIPILSNSTFDSIKTPVLLESLKDIFVVQATIGHFLTAILSREGRVYTLSWGVDGRLGHDTDATDRTPRLLSGVLEDKPVVQIAAGNCYLLALAFQPNGMLVLYPNQVNLIVIMNFIINWENCRISQIKCLSRFFFLNSMQIPARWLF